MHVVQAREVAAGGHAAVTTMQSTTSSSRSSRFDADTFLAHNDADGFFETCMTRMHAQAQAQGMQALRAHRLPSPRPLVPSTPTLDNVLWHGDDSAPALSLAADGLPLSSPPRSVRAEPVSGSDTPSAGSQDAEATDALNAAAGLPQPPGVVTPGAQTRAHEVDPIAAPAPPSAQVWLACCGCACVWALTRCPAAAVHISGGPDHHYLLCIFSPATGHLFSVRLWVCPVCANNVALPPRMQ